MHLFFFVLVLVFFFMPNAKALCIISDSENAERVALNLNFENNKSFLVCDKCHA